MNLEWLQCWLWHQPNSGFMATNEDNNGGGDSDGKQSRRQPQKRQ